PEAFKTASQLIVTDKGGLTYQPLVGLYEQVGELDFSSMYPTMMARFNISPETIGCACCPDSRVPEINYTVCRRRRGLVPQVPRAPITTRWRRRSPRRRGCRSLWKGSTGGSPFCNLRPTAGWGCPTGTWGSSRTTPPRYEASRCADPTYPRWWCRRRNACCSG